MKRTYLTTDTATRFKRAVFIFFSLFLITQVLLAQTGTWQLWASGLQAGSFPRLAIAPNHDIYYGLNGVPGTKGIIYKANTLQSTGTFTAMPTVPVPTSITNNIQTMICNNNNEPVVGVFRSNTAEPFLYRYDNATSAWVACTEDVPASLGAFCMAKSPNGTLWVGAKWSYVYKSTDGGVTYTHIDETAKVQNSAPCYYPTWNGNNIDGAVYAINVDGNGRVYAGTEGAGVVYSDDDGATWYPTDFHACKTSNPNQKDSTSNMMPLSHTGNVGGIGFTSNNNLVWNGTDMWTFNWTQNLGYADMTNHTVTCAQGITNYFFGSGLQITKIVTTANGQLFLHSGSNASVTTGTIGIYTSFDGINWTPFNTGITGLNDGQSQGSLAVDGNKVYMATHDGKIFVYDAGATAVGIQSIEQSKDAFVYPNPACNYLSLKHPDSSAKLFIYNNKGEQMECKRVDETTLNIEHLSPGVYTIQRIEKDKVAVQRFVKVEY